MEAVSLTGIRSMQVTGLPGPPPPGKGEVLIRVSVVGVCGSDVHYYSTGRIGSQVVHYPFVIGHEMSGIVEETGAGVDGLNPGDRVAVDPAMPCGECNQCQAGRRHTCYNLSFLGNPGQAQGCLCEKIVLPVGSCFSLPEDMDLELAALCEPLSIGLYAKALAGIEPGERVGIFGAGPIGLSVMLACLNAGAEAVYVSDPLDYRGRTAVEHGATWHGNPEKTDVVREIQKNEPDLLDTVFECCGKQEAMDQAVSLLKPGGKLMIVGIPRFQRYSFPADPARRNELTIQNVRRQNECMQPAIDAVTSGAIDPSFMLTHRFPMRETKNAFDMVENYSDGVIKATIVIDSE